MSWPIMSPSGDACSSNAVCRLDGWAYDRRAEKAGDIDHGHVTQAIGRFPERVHDRCGVPVEAGYSSSCLGAILSNCGDTVL